MKNNTIFKSSTFVAAFLFFTTSFAQDSTRAVLQTIGQVHGNFQSDVQYYNPDSSIGAPVVPEKVLMNGFANINYTYGDHFAAGIRYESYLNAMQGFDPRYKGTGIPYRYARYKAEQLEVTVGSFYEQFGNGLIFRSYEERGLGFDNAMDGIRVKFTPHKAVQLKGLIGKQRSFFSSGPGIVRGFDGELLVNELSEALSQAKTKITLGGSFVSKFQADQDPLLNLPENVGATAGRLSIIRGNVNFTGEYAYKINDPSTVNNNIYKEGQALLLMASYAKKGFGLTLNAKRIDNMNYRSDRAATGNNLLINFLPALTKPHTYSLMIFYPYATQPNGEIGYQSELFYKFKKDSKLGGKYGTDITISYSGANALDTVNLNDMSGSRKGYSSEFFSVGKMVYFQDFFVEINKKFSKKVKSTFVYSNQTYNKAVIQGLPDEPTIYSHIGVADVLYKLTVDKAVRIEGQVLITKQDKGSWAHALVEYTHGTHWFGAIQDQYNYGNSVVEGRIHYFTAILGYVKNANRITISYGKLREGIFCVGGVCRNVPASNGISLSITSSF